MRVTAIDQVELTGTLTELSVTWVARRSPRASRRLQSRQSSAGAAQWSRGMAGRDGHPPRRASRSVEGRGCGGPPTRRT